MSAGETPGGEPAVAVTTRRFGARLRLRVLRTRVEDEVRDRYLGSALGLWWTVLHPLIQMATYLVIFGMVFRMRPPSHLPALDPPLAGYLVFLMSGLIPWLAFSDGSQAAMESVVQNGHIVKSLPFPLDMLPVAAVLANLVPFFVSAGLLGLVMLVLGVPPSPWLLLLPVALALQLALTIGLGWFLAALLVFVRDVRPITQSILTALFFLSPVLWHPDQPEMAPFRAWTFWNPMTHLLTMYRNMLYGTGFLGPLELAWLLLWALGLAALGRAFFKRTEPHFESLL